MSWYKKLLYYCSPLNSSGGGILCAVVMILIASVFLVTGNRVDMIFGYGKNMRLAFLVIGMGFALIFCKQSYDYASKHWDKIDLERKKNRDSEK